MPGLHEPQLILVASQGAEDAVDAVPGKPVDRVHVPCDQSLTQVVCCGHLDARHLSKSLAVQEHRSALSRGYPAPPAIARRRQLADIRGVRAGLSRADARSRRRPGREGPSAEPPTDRRRRGRRVHDPDGHSPRKTGHSAWDETTIVVVHAHAAEQTGLGYTYADLATAKLIESKLAGVVTAWTPRHRAARGQRWSRRSATSAGRVSPRWRSRQSTSRSGTCTPGYWIRRSAGCWAMPMSACPCTAQVASPTTRDERLQAQLAGWVAEGIPRVKMKVGAEPAAGRPPRRAGPGGGRCRSRAVRRRQRGV